MTARVRSGLNKFKEALFLTSKGPTLKLKGKVYAACVRPGMVYDSETWAMKAEHRPRLEKVKMRMIIWISKVSLRDRITSADLRERCGVQPIK